MHIDDSVKSHHLRAFRKSSVTAERLKGLAEQHELAFSADRLDENHADFNTFSVTTTLRANLMPGAVEDAVFFEPTFRTIEAQRKKVPLAQELGPKDVVNTLSDLCDMIDRLACNGAVIHFAHATNSKFIDWVDHFDEVNPEITFDQLKEHDIDTYRLVLDSINNVRATMRHFGHIAEGASQTV